MQQPAKCEVHLRTTEGSKVATLLEMLNPLLIEGTITFTETGMSIKGVNLVVLADAEINDAEDYSCAKPQSVSVNFATLHSCISSIGQDEALCIQITKAGRTASIPYLSVFVINNSGVDESVFAYKVTLLALEQEDFDVPDTNFASVVSIPSASFQRVLRCCERRGNYVQICTRTQSKDENFIIFVTQGDEASLTFHMKYQTENRGVWKDTSCLKMERYSLKYMLLITKATSLSNFVTLYLAKETVLAIRYSVGTIGSVTICLAPQIDASTVVPPPVVSVQQVLGDDEVNTVDDAESGKNSEGKDENDAAALPKRKPGYIKPKLVMEPGKESKASSGNKEEQEKKTDGKEKKATIKEKNEGNKGSKKESKKEGKKESKKAAAAASGSSSRQMQLVDNGVLLKKQQRKRKRADEDETAAALLPGESVQFSATNMQGVTATTVTDALMRAARGAPSLQQELVLPDLGIN